MTRRWFIKRLGVGLAAAAVVARVQGWIPQPQRGPVGLCDKLNEDSFGSAYLEISRTKADFWGGTIRPPIGSQDLEKMLLDATRPMSDDDYIFFGRTKP